VPISEHSVGLGEEAVGGEEEIAGEVTVWAARKGLNQEPLPHLDGERGTVRILKEITSREKTSGRATLGEETARAVRTRKSQAQQKSTHPGKERRKRSKSKKLISSG